MVQCNRESTCPFCRSSISKVGVEVVERLSNRINANDPEAHFNLGGICISKDLKKLEIPQDREKGLQLLLRGCELVQRKHVTNSPMHIMMDLV